MSEHSEYVEYEDIVHLFKQTEWRAWVRFIDNRVIKLSDRVVKLVHEKNFEEAMCVEAIITDIKKQLDAFRFIKIRYENGTK